MTVRAKERPTAATSRGLKTSERVARKIVRSIVQRGLAPGEMLPSEAAMVDEYGVGRASLREALRILEVHDLIRLKPGVGGGPMVGTVEPAALGSAITLFLQMSGSTLGSLLQARVELEVGLVPLVLQRPDRELDRLRRNLKRAAAVDMNDVDDFTDVAGEFHRTISGLCGNSVLDLLCRSLTEIFHSRVDPELYPVDKRERVREEHEHIAAAIFNRNEKRAMSLARAHLNAYLESIEERHPALIDRLVDWR